MKKTPLIILLCAGVAFAPAIMSSVALAKSDKSKPAQPSLETVQSVQDKIDDEILSQLVNPVADTSFKDMLVATYQNNPELKAAQGDMRALFQQLPLADSAWKPSVEAGASATTTHNKLDPGGNDTLNTTAGELTVTQPLFRGGRTVAGISTAQNSIRAGIATVQSRTSQILLSAISAYADLIRDQDSVELNAANLSLLAKQLNAAQERFKVGDVTRTDVAQAESRHARAKASLMQAQAQLKTSRANFTKITGLDITPTGLPLQDIEMPVDLDTALKTAMDWNPSLRAAKYTRAAAGYSINSALGEHLPEVALQGGLSTARNPTSALDQNDSASVGVVATIPLYTGGATTARVKQARQSFNARTADVAATERAVIASVTQNWEDWQSARAEIDARRAQVKAAGVAQFGMGKESEFGSRTILDALDADQEMLDARLALANAERGEILARYGLLASMGLLTPHILGFGDKVPDYNREVLRARRGF